MLGNWITTRQKFLWKILRNMLVYQSNSKVKQKTVVLVAPFACYIWMVIGKVKKEINKMLKGIFKLIKNYHHSYVKIGNIGDKKLIHSKNYFYVFCKVYFCNTNYCMNIKKFSFIIKPSKLKKKEEKIKKIKKSLLISRQASTMYGHFDHEYSSAFSI